MRSGKQRGNEGRMNQYLENPASWTPPALPDKIPQGDMPGDRIEIGEEHIKKAQLIFRELLAQAKALKQADSERKIVIAVCGGSGVGKSETASLLSFYFQQAGIGSYTLSGDNYPRRIPMYNDAERLRIFRESAIRGMVRENLFSQDRFKLIHENQVKGTDADAALAGEYDWYESYLRNGACGLREYLGSDREINFAEIEEIVDRFKRGEHTIWLKRMGRTDTELWYEEIDFSDTEVLIIEWTHGNSDYYQGVDIPVLLNSTPQETMEHRRARNRDGAVDSPFTTLVLVLEQEMLAAQAHKAKIIVSKAGRLLSYEEYKEMMDAGRISERSLG